jgi:hypothetical protein
MTAIPKPQLRLPEFLEWQKSKKANMSWNAALLSPWLQRPSNMRASSERRRMA